MELNLFGKQYFINKILLICILIFLILGSGVLGFFLKQVYHPLSSPVVTQDNEIAKQSPAGETPQETQMPEEKEEIKVYVTGCVNKPGVITLEKGQLIDDAIKAAGGATKEADLENINLAYELKENLMLRIKSKPTASNKAAAVAGTPETAQPSKTGANPKNNTQTVQAGQGKAAENKVDTGSMNSGIDIISGSLDTVVEEEGETAGEEKKNNRVNINKATQAELENLPNIGPATAKAIIDYREKSGGFQKVTDIMKITGIKQKTYDKIKDDICID